MVNRTSGNAAPALRVGLILLAAGPGSRMGIPKWRVIWRGHSFLAWIRACILRTARLLGPRQMRLEPCIVAPMEEYDAVAQAWPNARIVANPDPGSEPFTSIRIGVQTWGDAYPDLLGIWPVDHPAVPPRDLAHLLETARQDLAGRRIQVWKPGYHGDTGHPVILGPQLIPELLEPHRETSLGLRGILRDWRDRCRIVAMTTPAVLWNFNTPEHLERYDPLWEPEAP